MTNETIVDFANKCLGYQTACKITHWIDLVNTNHKYADEFFDKLIDFTDEVIEDASFTYGRLEHGQIQPYQYDFEKLEDVVNSFVDDLILFRQAIEAEANPRDLGIISLCDDFIHTTNQYGYRSQLGGGHI